MAETIQERKQKMTEAKYVLEPDFPREIFIDFTSFCNHKCIFCSNSRLKNKKFMEPAMVVRVLNEAYESGIRDLGLYATGESFLVKNLAEYITLAKKIGFNYLFITTNGALVTPERAKPVLDAGLDSIKFSISAGTRESFLKVQGVDDFDKIIENLKWVSKYRQESGLKYRIYVTMVFTDLTKEEVPILKEIVLPYIDEWDPHPMNNQCGNLYENNKLGLIEANNPRARGKMDICFQPFKGFTVTPEGYVTACVLDYSKDLIVGDLNKFSMKEIWTGDVYKAFRKRHLDKNLNTLICDNCMHNTCNEVVPLMPEYASHFK